MGFFSKDRIRKRWSKILGFVWSHRSQIIKVVVDVAAEKIKDNSSAKGDEIVDKVKSELDKVLPIFLLCLLPIAFGCASIPTIEDIPRRDYVALGDSVTAGVGANGVVDLKDPFSSVDRGKAYPYLVTKALGVKHANFAVPGAMADDVNRIQVALALLSAPKTITLWVGGNDLVQGRAPEAYGADLMNILSSLIESDAKILVLNLPDVWKAGRFVEAPDKDVTEKRVAAFNLKTSAVAKTYGVTLVDISGPDLVAPELLANDQFHVNEAGHKYLSGKVLAAINAK